MRTAWLVAAVLLLGATPTPPPPSVLGVTFHYIRPSWYTQGIYGSFDGFHSIALPQGTPKHKLFVWLPATNANPDQYLYIQAVAARAGFHVIGLEYPNGPQSIYDLCASSRDPACWGNVRSEIVFGTRSSPLVNVNPTNSIVRRLAHLLHYLSSIYPNEGWGRYLNGNQPNWKLIELGGHSQGAGHAPFIGKYFRILGSCSIEGPPDENQYVPVAGWLTKPGKTPASVEFGFANSLDSYTAYSLFLNDWDALHFRAPAGPIVSVDGAEPPYLGAHELYTTMAFGYALTSHNYTASDYITPVGSDGTPVFAPVWSYICGFNR